MWTDRHDFTIMRSFYALQWGGNSRQYRCWSLLHLCLCHVMYPDFTSPVATGSQRYNHYIRSGVYPTTQFPKTEWRQYDHCAYIQLFLLKFFIILFCTSKQMLAQHIKIDHNSFLKRSFQLTIHNRTSIRPPNNLWSLEDAVKLWNKKAYRW